MPAAARRLQWLSVVRVGSDLLAARRFWRWATRRPALRLLQLAFRGKPDYDGILAALEEHSHQLRFDIDIDPTYSDSLKGAFHRSFDDLNGTR